MKNSKDAVRPVTVKGELYNFDVSQSKSELSAKDVNKFKNNSSGFNIIEQMNLNISPKKAIKKSTFSENNSTNFKSLSFEQLGKIASSETLFDNSNLFSDSRKGQKRICSQNEEYSWLNLKSSRTNLLQKVKKYIVEHLEEVSIISMQI